MWKRYGREGFLGELVCVWTLIKENAAQNCHLSITKRSITSHPFDDQ